VVSLLKLKTHKILVVGAPKSGTTALFYNIKSCLPPNAYSFFEPDKLPAPESVKYLFRDVLVKIVLSNPPELEGIDKYSKVVLIIRDPRDLLISALLYTSAFHSTWNKNEREILENLHILQRKESFPEKVSCHHIWKKMVIPRLPLEKFLQRMSWVMEVKQLTNTEVLFYEDFVNSHVDIVEKYLGFKIKEEAIIPKQYKRVARTKGSGNWRKWLTTEDVDYYKPYLNKFLDQFDYNSDDWELEQAIIEPAHCSEYYLKLVNERRVQNGLEPINMNYKISKKR